MRQIDACSGSNLHFLDGLRGQSQNGIHLGILKRTISYYAGVQLEKRAESSTRSSLQLLARLLSLIAEASAALHPEGKRRALRGRH